MSRTGLGVAVLLFALGTASAAAAAPQLPDPIGMKLVMPATGTVSRPNDEAYLTLMLEEQDKDKTVAASRVNEGMTRGSEIVRRQDPTAVLMTHGYYTYPVYPDTPQGTPRSRQPVAWRVGEYLDVRTRNLAALPKVVAASQGVLSVAGLRFGLSEAAARKLDSELVAAAYATLTERIAAAAQAMGKPVSDAILDSVDFEGSGAYAPKREVQFLSAMRADAARPAQVEQPSFEPGETSLSMSVVGRVHFK